MIHPTIIFVVEKVLHDNLKGHLIFNGLRTEDKRFGFEVNFG
jgi:hypothetical protein